MTVIHIATIDAPLSRPSLLGPAVGLVRRALALGLLGGREEVTRLDLDLLRGIAREASAAGIGQDAALELLAQPTPARLGSLIGRLDDALVASPLPERELAQLSAVFDTDVLAALAGTSPVSLRRYAAGSRTVPDAIAARLHWLALVASDLAGSYNPVGIRRWFERPRTQLGGESPREVLGEGWDPYDPRVDQVRALAEALTGAGGAT
jgi:hypothetical protein